LIPLDILSPNRDIHHYLLAMGRQATLISSDNLLEKIRTGNRQVLQGLYHDFRQDFVKWAMKYYRCDEETAGEAYQQAFVALYYNIKNGKLTELSSSIKTYLFAIGKNMLREQFKSRFVPFDLVEQQIESEAIDTTLITKFEQSDMKELVRGLLLRIGEPCKTVLQLFYFQDYAMEAIANEMGYKTEQIAAKRKFICLQQLRTMMSHN